jgi:hypothetical protein
MSDDFSNVFKQVSDMLSQGNPQETLGNLLGMLENVMGNSNDQNSSEANSQERNQKSGPSINPENMQLFMKLAQALQKTSNGNDPRSNLLNSLKPYMGKKKQDKVDQLIKLLSLSEVFQILTNSKEEGKN